MGNSRSFLSAARAFSAIGVAIRVGYLRTNTPSWDMLWDLGDGIETEAGHEAVFLEHAGKHSLSRFNVTLTPTLAYNLVRPYVVAGSCAFSEAPHPLDLRLVREAGNRVLFEWIDKISTDSRLTIAWVDGTNKPVYTPLVLTSNSSGVVEIPDGISGLLLTVLSLGGPLDDWQGTLAGPEMVDLDYPTVDLLAFKDQYDWKGTLA